MAMTSRITAVLERLQARADSLLDGKPKHEQGKGHEFPPHTHDALTHLHGHSHVTHYRKPGERDDWQHLTTTHGHEHNHAAVTHLHIPHDELRFEHVHEAHIHDHASPIEK